MPFSTDVNLPKNHSARFPDRCVVCGETSPASSIRLFTSAFSWWSWLTWIGRPFCVRAPACTFCGWRLRLLRLANLTLTILLIWIAIAYLWPLVANQVPRGMRKLAILGLSLMCLAPQFLYQLFFPHPFDVTAYADSVDYEFRDAQLAREFAELNEDAKWVKLN